MLLDNKSSCVDGKGLAEGLGRIERIFRHNPWTIAPSRNLDDRKAGMVSFFAAVLFPQPWQVYTGVNSYKKLQGSLDVEG